MPGSVADHTPALRAPSKQGSGLREQIAAILQPLFHVRMESWSDFSTRLPAKQVTDGAALLLLCSSGLAASLANQM